MKRPISIILLLTLLIALSACNSNVSIHQPSKSPSIETSSDPYEKGMFEDVTYIRIVTNAHEDAPYAYNIIIDSPEAIERFVDDIRPIEKAKQVELKGERFKDYALEDI